jgi:hypothetical protein
MLVKARKTEKFEQSYDFNPRITIEAPQLP